MKSLFNILLAYIEGMNLISFSFKSNFDSSEPSSASDYVKILKSWVGYILFITVIG